MMTRQIVLDQLDAYLNHQMTLAVLVDWAENALIEPQFLADEDVELLMDVLMYLGAADSRGFPLTWEILSDFLTRLGGRARVVVELA
ncbi:MAG: hypothetical protein H0X30_11830 [Anaerolineae bacterium]|nr:hypothetical protein [Anaerolineae bacterium]